MRPGLSGSPHLGGIYRAKKKYKRKRNLARALVIMLVLNRQHLSGSGVFNSVLNSLPIELHYPGYNYLGPGTNLAKRLSRGDKGVNPLDEAAKQHDIFYSQHKDTESRHIADKELENKAWNRVLAKDSSFGEKAAAYLTTNLMKAKRYLGMGLEGVTRRNKRRYKNKRRRKQKRRKRRAKKKAGASVTFPSLVRALNKQLHPRGKGISFKEDVSSDLKKYASKSLKLARKKAKGKKKIKVPRVIPIPRTGGALPLVPILAGIAAVKTIAGGVDSIVNTIKNIVEAKRKIFPGSKETLPVGKGLFLSGRNKGYGLFLDPEPKN